MALVTRNSVVGRASIPSQAVPPSSGHENAAAVPSLPARGWAMLSGLGMTGFGALGAWNINQMVQPTAFQIGDTTSAFGALFVFTAAVERVLEPFSRWLPGSKQQARYEQALADVDNGVPGAMNAAAHYKAAVDSARASRGVIMWGLATLAATLLSAASGFYLLRMLSSQRGWHGIPAWADALVTGVVIGSGTKPVHDIIMRFQRGAGV